MGKMKPTTIENERTETSLEGGLTCVCVCDFCFPSLYCDIAAFYYFLWQTHSIVPTSTKSLFSFNTKIQYRILLYMTSACGWTLSKKNQKGKKEMKRRRSTEEEKGTSICKHTIFDDNKNPSHSIDNSQIEKRCHCVFDHNTSSISFSLHAEWNMKHVFVCD